MTSSRDLSLEKDGFSTSQPRTALHGAGGKAGGAGAICAAGCASAHDCTGACQPPLLRRTGKRCRWCDEGCRLIGDEHWIVESINPARITIRACKAVEVK